MINQRHTALHSDFLKVSSPTEAKTVPDKQEHLFLYKQGKVSEEELMWTTPTVLEAALENPTPWLHSPGDNQASQMRGECYWSVLESGHVRTSAITNNQNKTMYHDTHMNPVPAVDNVNTKAICCAN